jgi:hypothetical protein
MSELRVGDRIVVRGETVVIAGFSPVSVVPAIVYLDDPETGERLDAVLLEEVVRATRDEAT